MIPPLNADAPATTLFQLVMQTKSTHALDAEPNAPPPVHKTVSSSELFGSCREVRIVHHGEQYTLRLTRLGKLILTK